jgi:hypothetical protein
VNLIKGFIKSSTEAGDNCWQRTFGHLRLNKQCAREVVNVRSVSGGYTFFAAGSFKQRVFQIKNCHPELVEG